MAEEEGLFFMDLVSNKNVADMLNYELGCGDVNFIHIFLFGNGPKDHLW